MQLLLIRHALPLRAEALTGGSNPELAELGHRQAQALADSLAGEDIHAVAASPMHRAQQTAAPLARLKDLPVSTYDDLVEYDAGEQSYTPVHEIRESDPALWQQMLNGHMPEHIDLGAFRGRVLGALEQIIEAYPGRQTVAVFCHAGVINAALGGILETSLALPFAMDYCGISRVVAARSGRRSIVSVNETAHVRPLLELVTAG